VKEIERAVQVLIIGKAGFLALLEPPSLPPTARSGFRNKIKTTKPPPTPQDRAKPKPKKNIKSKNKKSNSSNRNKKMPQ
jgi:hypothetical protein